MPYVPEKSAMDGGLPHAWITDCPVNCPTSNPLGRHLSARCKVERAGILERLVEHFPGLAYRCRHDADWTLEFASSGALQLLGYTAEELVIDRVVSIADLIHQDDLPLFERWNLRRYKTGKLLTESMMIG